MPPLAAKHLGSLLQAPPPTPTTPAWTTQLFPGSCFSILGADLIVPGAGAIYKATFANLGVYSSFVFVVQEESACPIVSLHKDGMNNLLFGSSGHKHG